MLGASLSVGCWLIGGLSHPTYDGRQLWHPALWFSDRTIAILCIQVAVSGRCSPIWIPAALLSIGLNSPRISAGASGLRSHMSCEAAPPSRYSRMTLLAFPGTI